MADEASRAIAISPPPGRAETLHVARALFLVAFWSVAAITTQANTRRSAAAEGASDPPFVARFGSLDPTSQRAYRALQEGLVEAERFRARRGAWPTAAELAEDLIPPFAPDPIDRAGYAWTSFAAGRIVNYVGVPTDPTARTFVAILIEPEPGAAIDPRLVPDEIHHDVAGTLVHVSTFVGTGPGPRAAEPSVNFAEGWQQILIGPASVLGR
ncbi:MAG: hypothetical protein U0414_00325 [Polyangiaceae bacterium]